MALTFHTFQFLKKLNNEKFFFGETLSLGRINNLISKDEFKKLNIKKNEYTYEDKILMQNFNFLSLNYLDFSSFEDADIICDLNKPIENINRKFDTILDFGTSEHVFNINQCLKNIANLCKINGHIIQCLPANNNCGHGFWQFSPELFFKIYNKKNGFDNTEIFIIDLFDKNNWYQVNQQKSGERLELSSSEPLYILVKTKKISSSLFEDINQSDYEYQWSGQSNNIKINKSYISKLNKNFKDNFKVLLRENILTKKIYSRFEKKRLHNKNYFKKNKNLRKKAI